MHIESADALADAYSRAANDARHAIAELSPLVTESLALLDRPGQNPIHGPIPALQETANTLREDKHDLEWRVELLRSTDAQPLGVDGRILGFAPNNQPASRPLPHPTQDRHRLTELNTRIENWQGSDNDPLLDALLAERRDIETRQTDRRRSLDDQLAAFRRSEAESWTAPEWTPLETAEHSLTQISDILDTAKHDRGRGIGATVADGIWSTEDLETIIANEHGYYTATQVAHAQTVQAMATSSPEARDHLGITQSDDGWTFTDIGHLTLDIFGMAPIIGNAADGINATWYAAEGEYLDAALSSIALIPGLGQIIAPARQTIRAAAGGRVFRSLDDALAWTKGWIENTGLWRFSDEAVRGADSAVNVANHQRYVEELRRTEIEGIPGPEGAVRAADDALASGQTSGAAAQFDVEGQSFVDVSGSSTPLHPDVQRVLDDVPAEQRTRWHEGCAEPRCVSQALDAGIDPSSGVMNAVQIGTPGVIPHGNLRPPCRSCTALRNAMGYRQ